MYRIQTKPKNKIKRNTSYIGETIEQKIKRITQNKEPIKDGAPLVYTDRKNGVEPQYDIRTDRFEVAVEAMDKVTGAHQAKREERHKLTKEQQGTEKKDGGTEPAPATDNN